MTREWRNRQTRTFEGRVGRLVRVQVPSLAPKNIDTIWCLYFFAMRCMIWTVLYGVPTKSVRLCGERKDICSVCYSFACKRIWTRNLSWRKSRLSHQKIAITIWWLLFFYAMRCVLFSAVMFNLCYYNYKLTNFVNK